MNSQELLKELIWFDTTKCFINGAWKKPVSKQYIDLFDPSDNSLICKIPRSNKSDGSAICTEFPKLKLGSFHL